MVKASFYYNWAMTDNLSTAPENQAALKVAAMDCGLLLVCWLLMLACAMPSGNFPLNDDWNYARTVKTLLDEHRLMITHWSLAASLPHIFLGWVACLFGGFSFAALRAVSQLAALASGLMVYFLSVRGGASRVMALLAGVVWLTNPLVFNVANTFMTDLTFIMLAGCTICCMASAANEETPPWRLVWLASLLSVLACLTRQTGIVIPIAFLLATKFDRKAFVPLVLSAASIWAFEKWLVATMGTLQSYRVEQAWIQSILQRGPMFVISNMMSNLICAFVYLGLFLFPLLLALYPPLVASLSGKSRKNALILFVEPIVLLAVGLLITHSVMPLGDNVLFNLGLGPVLLGGTAKQVYTTAPSWFWIMVTTCGVIGVGAIASTLIAVSANKPSRGVVFVLAVFWLYLSVIGFRGFFDRYLMFPLFLLLPVVTAAVRGAQSDSRWKVLRPIAHLIVLLYASFAVAGTHDYFAWNRAKWLAAHDLAEVAHVSPMDIDGGLEFNGWWGYDPQYRDVGGITLAGDMRHGNEYIIAMTYIPGYEVVSRYSFQRWLPAGGGEILVLRKVH